MTTPQKCIIRLSYDLWRELKRHDRTGEGDELDIMQEILAKMGIKEARLERASDYGQEDRGLWLLKQKGDNLNDINKQ